MQRTILSVFLLAVIFFAPTASAQEQQMLPDQSDPDFFTSAASYVDSLCDVGQEKYALLCEEADISVTKLVSATAQMRLAELTRAEGYKVRQFGRHEAASWFAFVAAHLFVLIGAFAAILEFRHAYKTRPGQSIEMDVQIQLSGVAIRSATLGTIILTVTLAFYFAYLALVYPIT